MPRTALLITIHKDVFCGIIRAQLVGEIDEGKIDQQLVDAGWVTNGSCSEHIAIGESEDLCVLVHRSTWETEEPSYRGLSEWAFCQRRHVRAYQVLDEDVLR